MPGVAGAFQLGAADTTTDLVVAAGIAGTIAIFFGIALIAPFLIVPMTAVLSWPLRRVVAGRGPDRRGLGALEPDCGRRRRRRR